jgi:hypothetical protein
MHWNALVRCKKLTWPRIGTGVGTLRGIRMCRSGLVNDLTLLIVNGRFERQELLPRSPPNKTTVDYFILHSDVFTDVVDCRIYHETIKTPECFGIESDHKLMSLTLALPYDDSK